MPNTTAKIYPKGSQISALVDRLHDISVDYGQSPELRNRISQELQLHLSSWIGSLSVENILQHIVLNELQASYLKENPQKGNLTSSDQARILQCFQCRVNNVIEHVQEHKQILCQSLS